MSQPVSAAAKGQVRLLLAKVAADADAISRAVEAIPKAMAMAATRKGIGSRAARDRVIKRVPLPVLATGPQRGADKNCA